MSTDTANAGAQSVVLFAHGSRAAAANESHRATCAALQQRIGAPVLPAFLELAEPDLVTAVRRAVDAGAGDIVVVPFLLAPGRHATEDLPALVEEARAAHPHVEIRLNPIFGEDPAVIELLAAQISA